MAGLLLGAGDAARASFR